MGAVNAFAARRYARYFDRASDSRVSELAARRPIGVRAGRLPIAAPRRGRDWLAELPAMPTQRRPNRPLAVRRFRQLEMNFGVGVGGGSRRQAFDRLFEASQRFERQSVVD